MIRFLIFILSSLFFCFGAYAEQGFLYGKKVKFKSVESIKHPGYTELTLTGDATIPQATMTRIQFLQIALMCKEKHFHAMVEHTPEDGKSFAVIRCKADDVADDKDKKEAGIIPHKKDLQQYCAEPETEDEKKDSWLNDPEIKKMCEKYKKLLAKTKS